MTAYLRSLAGCLAFGLVLSAAFLLGEHRRCQALIRDSSPLVATYCPEANRP